MLPLIINTKSRNFITAIFYPNKGIFKFTGRSIPGVLRVLSIDNKRYMCSVIEGCEIIEIHKDLDKNLTWESVFENYMVNGITNEMIETFIRAYMPRKAAELDSENEYWNDCFKVTELIQEQVLLSELRTELAQIIKECRETKNV